LQTARDIERLALARQDYVPIHHLRKTVNGKKLLQYMFGLMLVLFLLTGCGETSSEPKTGFWEGQGQNLTVSFEISTDGKIHNYAATYFLDGGTCIIIWEAGLISEADHTFLLGEKDADGGLAKNSFSGKFSSATTVEGTRGLILQCDDTVIVNTQDAWNARWIQPPYPSQQYVATLVPTPTLVPELP
jgi:hypothetical protein